MKWYIGLNNGYCGIEEAETQAQARKQAKHTVRGRFGEPACAYDPDITEVRPATRFDLSWIDAMSGKPS